MGVKLVVGPQTKGLRKDVIPVYIDNDAFPVLINAYQWRGRAKRKRGTSLLGRLQRYFNSLSSSYNSGSITITLDGSGNGNLLTGFSLQTNGNIIPGTVTITAPGPTVYTDPSMDGTLSPSGSINYATGAITILAQAGMNVSASFNYYPNLPVMGLENLLLNPNLGPGYLDFDTVYSYNVLNTFPYAIYDVSFYKNPPTSTYVGYTQKTNVTPTSWNGQNYQQFWTVNYQGALWETNGVPVPFTGANIGMQFKPIVSTTIVSGGPPATVTLQITGHGLVVGDIVFVNEVITTTGINFQTGYVITVTDANNVVVEFPNATIATNGTGGIAQYLTSRSSTTKDCLRWYDGDPTTGAVNPPVLTGRKGWVNFAPPISQSNFSIGDLPAAQYYLVGAKMIVPFKDRLLFLGAVVQSSSTGPFYLQDTIVYSQNGTPYYTCSFTGNVDSSATVFHPILVPDNQTATATAYFSDQTGFGGFQSAGLSEAITTADIQGDAIIIGFNQTFQTRLVYSGNDLIPFNFYIINSELPSGSTFSSISMDGGTISRGDRGYIITSQTSARRFDLDIPDEVFQMRLTNNGAERFTAQRDFINEWIFFTYPCNQFKSSFPTRTLQYNYRDNTWGIFNECYTTYGEFKRSTGFTWGTVGTVFPTWGQWNQPWNAGASTLMQPDIVAGNQQGFVVFKDEGTGESVSLYIQSFSGSTVTSPDHALNIGDYIVISGCIGTISSQVNGKIFSVGITTQNTFTLNPPIGSGTYFGGGLITRMYVPLIQSKQFPFSWDMARKTRIGVQQYLLTTTDNAQVQLLMYLSQNGDNPYNNSPIVPSPNVTNSSLIYSTVLYTCPESCNLGLTPANSSLQMICDIDQSGTNASSPQSQIWHRINTSLIGDTVQIGITLSDEQMRDTLFRNQFEEIELHGFIIDASPSQVLA